MPKQRSFLVIGKAKNCALAYAYLLYFEQYTHVPINSKVIEPQKIVINSKKKESRKQKVIEEKKIRVKIELVERGWL